MTCETCGDKPKKDKHFPSAVIEINNPESLVLLRKVVIPASLGDDTAIPPAIGKYRNVILVYEANEHIYLYSSDGIPTLLETEVPQEVLDRIANLETDLALETSLRQDADAGLSDRIDTKQDALTPGDNISIEEESGALVISAEDTTYSAGNGLSLSGTEFSVDTATIATQQDLSAEALARSDADTALSNRVATIEGEIPAAASSSNQLADKNFVNSSVATNTANYISNNGEPFTSVAQLEAYSGTVTNNDYAFVTGTDGVGNTYYDRYKATVTGTPATVIWAKEYRLNNSSFTSDQWAAINSTVTSGDMTKLRALANIKSIGTNLSLDANGKLSATDTTYTAGNGLSLNGTQFSVDTTAIATQSDLTTGLATKQNTLTAGSNIQINNDTISATDTTYTAGYGLNLAGTEFSVDSSIVQDALTAGDNISIAEESGALVISATDTTYSTFTGTDGTASGTSGLVPAPATTDAGKVLGANGNWVTGGPTVVQTLGTSTSDVMSQNAVTSSLFADPGTNTAVRIGSSRDYAGNTYSVAIGNGASSATGGVAIGAQASGASDYTTATNDSIAIGPLARAMQQYTVAIGPNAFVNDGNEGIALGHSAYVRGNYSTAIGVSAKTASSAAASTAIGYNSSAQSAGSIAIGGGSSSSYAETTGAWAIAIGGGSRASGSGSIAIGNSSEASMQGEMNIGLPRANASSQASYGYNGSAYRLLTGLYDPQSAHDAATKGYVDTELSYKQDELTAGDGITIEDESGSLVISAIGPDVFTTNEWNALWA